MRRATHAMRSGHGVGRVAFMSRTSNEDFSSMFSPLRSVVPSGRKFGLRLDAQFRKRILSQSAQVPHPWLLFSPRVSNSHTPESGLPGKTTRLLRKFESIP